MNYLVHYRMVLGLHMCCSVGYKTVLEHCMRALVDCKRVLAHYRMVWGLHRNLRELHRNHLEHYKTVLGLHRNLWVLHRNRLVHCSLLKELYKTLHYNLVWGHRTMTSLLVMG